MLSLFKLIVAAAVVLLAGCGGGDSTTTTITGGGLNNQLQSPAVGLPYPFVQTANNLPLTVDTGVGFSLAVNTLYASVTLCEPGGGACQTIDHVLVDTGSMGLRVLASKVGNLQLAATPTGTNPVWECYPFVIGGLWGATVVAQVGLGQQISAPIPVQLIQDSGGMQTPPGNCATNVPGGVMSSASQLGANGILGIGSVTLDCGATCVSGNYQALSGSGTPFYQYYTCPVGAADANNCVPAAVAANFQLINPVATLPSGYNNGVIVALPALPPSTNALGAATVSGELILGIDTPNAPTNNQLGNLQPLYLGTSLGPSYLSITTQFKGQSISNSYLDTGSNALAFNDTGSNAMAPCGALNVGVNWYCPANTTHQTALLSDGVAPALSSPVSVNFDVANADALLSSANAAFATLASTTPAGSAAFAWGLPFFYGRRVYLSIWDLSSPVGPWYAWSAL